MASKYKFNLNQEVTLKLSSSFYKDQCYGMTGIITTGPSQSRWWEIKWENGTKNSYPEKDIVSLVTDWDE